VGTQVRIVHFGGGVQDGVVVSVAEQGRRVRVRAEHGEELEFVLSPATARFVFAGGSAGPRLELPSGG
jgi:hypothetical protein